MNKKIILLSVVVFASIFSFGQLNLEVSYEYDKFVNPRVLSKPFVTEIEKMYVGDIIDTVYRLDGNDTVFTYLRETYRENSTKPVVADFQYQHSVGIGAGVSLSEYFDFGFRFNLIEFKTTEILKSMYRSEYYDYNNIEWSYMELNDLKFNIKTASSSFSVKYPLGDFVPEVFIGGNLYSTDIDHIYKSGFCSKDEYVYSDSVYIKKRYSGVGFGIQCGIGLTYFFNDNIGVFTNIAFSRGALMLSKGELLSDTKNGLSMYEEIPHVLHESHLPFRRLSYDNFSLRFGVKYKFLKNQMKEKNTLTDF